MTGIVQRDADFHTCFQALWGVRYVIDFPMMRVGRRATVRSAWIVRTGEAFPRLTSCYVL